MGRMGRRAALAVVATGAFAVCVSAAAAIGEAPNRAEYVSRLEKICRPGAEATRRAMDGVRDDMHADRIRIAAHKFGRAKMIFGTTVRKISRRPRPIGDRVRLRKWFTYLKRQESFLKRISAQLRAGRTIKAQRLTARFIHNGNLANNVTLAFGFNYCSFKFSRYG